MSSLFSDMLDSARANNYAIPAFSAFGYEDALAVVEAANLKNAPIILSANLDLINFMSPPLVFETYKAAAKHARVPICIHLDHHYELDRIKACIDAGFQSVMYDGSQLPIEQNIANTQQIIDYAKPRGVGVEAEIGSVPYSEGRDHIKNERTKLSDAKRMAEIDIDCLAVSVGNVHRMRKGQKSPKIDFELLEEIERTISAIHPLPLVIHGMSGISESDIKKLAKRSVCKFNVGTRIREAFGSSLKNTIENNPKTFDRLTLLKSTIEPMKEEAMKVYDLML